MVINGVNYTFEDGFSATACVNVNLEDCNSVSWTSGSWDSETSWFLSDVADELDAAKAAGLKTLHLIRDGQAQSAHPYVHDFSTVKLEQFA